MGSTIKNGKNKTNKVESKKILDEVVYASEEVKNFAFSDYVKLRTGPRGMLFSFGKRHPDDKKITIYDEMLIPLDVAYVLLQIMKDQFYLLEKNQMIEVKKK